MIKVSRSIALALGLGLASGAASAFVQPFGVDPGAIGEAEAAFTASYIDFSYQATVDQGAGVAGVSSFSEDGIGFFSTFQHPSLGNPVAGTGLNSSYKLYALFSGDGTTTTNLAGGIDGTFSTFSLDIFADVASDTTFTLPSIGGADGSLSVSSTADDIHVASSGTLLANNFRVFPGLANGDFDVVVQMTSVATGIGGGEFFTDPFDLVIALNVDFNGVNTTLQGFAAPPTAFVDAMITGSGNLSVIPVPSILAVFGAGLLGLFSATRKRKA